MSQPQEQLHLKFQELFDLADQTIHMAQSVLEEFNRRHLKLFDLPANQRIFLFIVTRSLKTYFSIVELCKKGFGQDVATLLRSLLENLVTAKYITYDQKTADEKASRFVAYKWVIFKRHLPDQERNVRNGTPDEKNEFLEKKARVLQKVEEFKEKFNVLSDRALVSWSGKTTRDMAKKVDKKLLREYENTFRICSRFSHPTILGDNEYLIQNDQKLIFSPLPSDIGIVPNLSNATKYTLMFLKMIDTLFGFQKSHAIHQLESKLEALIKSGKYQEAQQSSHKPNTSIRESTISFRTQF